MAIDVQQHFVPPSLARAYAEAGTGHADRSEVVVLEHRLDEMEAASIDYALLSVPVWDPYDRARDETAAAVSTWNDETIEAASAHAGRFGVLATLPLPFADAAIAELDRLRDTPIVRGVVLHATTSRWTLDAPEIEPVLAAVAEAGLTVLIHPSEEHIGRDAVFGDWRIGFWLAPVIETTLGVSRLMLSGVLDRVPSLTLIIPHLGGVLPYLAQRAIDLSGNGDAAADILHYLRTRCFVDNCSYYNPALVCALDTVGAGRIVIGSDYPFRGALRRPIEDIEASGLSEAQRILILRDNATACGLGPPT